MAQNKEQIKASKIELSNEDRTNLSDAEFKTLVIRMLTETVEYGYKIKEKVKAMKSEKRKMYREPKVKGRNLGHKSSTWGRKK